MRYIEVDVDDSTAYLLPIGDIHIGDRAFRVEGEDKLIGYLKWARERQDQARIILMGDIFNVATRASKTSPFETESSEFQRATDLFSPYANLIIGAIDGNHEARLRDFVGYSPLESFCRELKIPYAGWSATVRLRVGKRASEDAVYRQRYFIYAHHTTGGGGSLGNALNTVRKLEEVVQGCDVYLGGHNHQLVEGARDVWVPSDQSHACVKRRVHYVSCGGYLEWEGSYNEQAMRSPSKLGSPRIRFSGGDSKDVHCSI